MARMFVCELWGWLMSFNRLRDAARWNDWLLESMNTINLMVSECILHVNERGWLRLYKVTQQETTEVESKSA